MSMNDNDVTFDSKQTGMTSVIESDQTKLSRLRLGNTQEYIKVKSPGEK